jgi:hypothetical protein
MSVKRGIYCLENYWNGTVKDKLSVQPILELRETASSHSYIYHRCATREELCYMLSRWKLKGIQKGYPILYLGFHGTPGRFELNHQRQEFTLEELREELNKKAANRLIFFSSCSVLNIHENKIQKFLRQAGALAVAGYKSDVGWMMSAAFELLLFDALSRASLDSEGMKHLENEIKNEFGRLGKELEFRMVINKEYL